MLSNLDQSGAARALPLLPRGGVFRALAGNDTAGHAIAPLESCAGLGRAGEILLERRGEREQGRQQTLDAVEVRRVGFGRVAFELEPAAGLWADGPLCSCAAGFALFVCAARLAGCICSGGVVDEQNRRGEQDFHRVWSGGVHVSRGGPRRA